MSSKYAYIGKQFIMRPNVMNLIKLLKCDKCDNCVTVVNLANSYIKGSLYCKLQIWMIKLFLSTRNNNLLSDHPCDIFIHLCDTNVIIVWTLFDHLTNICLGIICKMYDKNCTVYNVNKIFCLSVCLNTSNGFQLMTFQD
jgi:hypothetical protein